MAYRITIELENVAEGDATDIAQSIWDENADACDADRGDFKIHVSKDGFAVDWEPAT